VPSVWTGALVTRCPRLHSPEFCRATLCCPGAGEPDGKLVVIDWLMVHGLFAIVGPDSGAPTLDSHSLDFTTKKIV
jgi:hypothetical protein